MNYTTHTTFADAVSASSKEEQEKVASAINFNKADAEKRIKQLSGIASEFLVIEGLLYYLYPLVGKEEGLTLLNRVELLGGCLHDGPFYRVFISPTTIVLDTEDGEVVKYRRDNDARRIYATRRWPVTTDDQLFFAQPTPTTD